MTKLFHTKEELEGMIKNSLRVKKCYVSPSYDRMDGRKTEECPIEVTTCFLTSKVLRLTDLNHVRAAVDNNGVYIRISKTGNPLAVVYVGDKLL